jgi:DNA-binding NarL/FixJ family response regulator
MPSKISIAIADSSPVFRMGLVSLVANAGRYALAGEASTPAELTSLLTHFSPDVVIMDFLSDGFSVDDVLERFVVLLLRAGFWPSLPSRMVTFFRMP